MSGSARDHYGRLAASYDENWVAHSEAFNGWMSERILGGLISRLMTGSLTFQGGKSGPTAAR